MRFKIVPHTLNILDEPLQKFLDALGLGTTLDSPYWRNLRKEVLEATRVILRNQINGFIKILERDPSKKRIGSDGTYSKVGHDSPDCFVAFMTRVHGEYKMVK